MGSAAEIGGISSDSSKGSCGTSRVHPDFRGGNPPYPHRFSVNQMKSLTAICDTFVPALPLDASGLPNHFAGVENAAELLTKSSLDDVDAFYRLSASDAGVPVEVAGRMFRTMKPLFILAVGSILWLLSTRLGTFILFGSQSFSGHSPFFQSFPNLSGERRQKALLSWASSSSVTFQKVFKLFKCYCLSGYYAKVDKNGWNPSWNAIGYTGPEPFIKKWSSDSTSDHSSRTRPLDGKVLDAKGPAQKLLSDLENGGFSRLEDISPLRSMFKEQQGGSRSRKREFGIRCDVVVVGSGSGGGVMAGVLAKAGHKVLVLEKGRYFAGEDLSLLEGPSQEAMYEGAGAAFTDDGKVTILHASTVGGGSTINWSASFQTPEHVRQEWAQELGLSVFATDKYQKAMDAVYERLGVNTNCEKESFQNQILRQGCKALGYDTGVIPQNTKGQHSCGWCNFGCKNGKKQSTADTWLLDAVTCGALILSNCQALGVLHRSSKTVGSEKTKPREAVGVAAALGEDAILYIEARATVVSCGSLSTPPLLLRSGLKNSNIGKHLHLHPVIMGWGYFPEDRGPSGNCYEGPIMTAVSKEVANWNSSGYGALLEVPIVHPGSFSAVIPWISGADHKGRMRKYSRTAQFISLTRDKGSGRVALDFDGKSAHITYSVSEYDQCSLFNGLDRGLRALVAAGAEEIGTHHCDGETFRVNKSSSEDLEAFLKRTREKGLGKLKFPVISAHQMGTCRMGINEKTSVVDERGETWEVKGLFLGDASVFPTASGVNPMITVQSIAYCTAQNVLLQLKKSN